MNLAEVGYTYRNLDNNKLAVLQSYILDTDCVILKFRGNNEIITIPHCYFVEHWVKATDQLVQDKQKSAEAIRAVPRFDTIQEKLEKQSPADIKRNTLLIERESTHGNFKLVSATAQELKLILKINESRLSYIQRESLDLICTKLARIVRGNSSEKDHWKDIIGYAELALEELNDTTGSCR